MSTERVKNNSIIVYHIFLISAGLLLNLIPASLVKYFNLPFYLDNIGTIIVSALGGALPGMFVGFVNNIVNSVFSPLSLYYSVLSVLIADAASYFSRKGLFKSIHGCLIASFCFAFIG